MYPWLKNRRISIHDIKQYTENKSPYYFNRKTMKSFGQTMANFRVRKSKSGRIFIFAPSYVDGKLAGFSMREFIPNEKDMYNSSLALISYDLKKEYDLDTFDGIMRFLEDH